VNAKRTISTLALMLLVTAWGLASAAAAFADVVVEPRTVPPSPTATPAPVTSAPSGVSAPTDSSGDDGRTATLAIAGAMVVLIAGGSVFALRRVSKTTAGSPKELEEDS
jgi:hypothetical protein